MKALKVILIVVASFIGVIVILMAGSYVYFSVEQSNVCGNQEMIEKCDPRQSFVNRWQEAQECETFHRKCEPYFAAGAPKTDLGNLEESEARKAGKRRQQEYLEQGLKEIEQSDRRTKAMLQRQGIDNGRVLRQHGINED